MQRKERMASHWHQNRTQEQEYIYGGARRGRARTWNVTVETGLPLLWVVPEAGAAACSMHTSDCHWFRLMESPTNSIFFPLHLLSKSCPLNLHAHGPRSIRYAILEFIYALQLILHMCNCVPTPAGRD